MATNCYELRTSFHRNRFRTPFGLFLWAYILSISLFSYRSGYVVISYVFCGFLVLAVLLQNKGSISVSILFVYMLCLVSVFGISVFFSINVIQTMRRFITMLLMFLTCVSIEQGFQKYSSEDVFDFFSSAIVETCMIAFMYDFLIIGPRTYLGNIIAGLRLREVASQTNVMGVFGSIAFNVIFYDSLVKKKKKNLFLLIVPFLMVIASQSKKAILCVIAGVFLILGLRYREKKILGVFLLSFTAALILLSTKMPIFSAILSRFSNAISTYSSNASIVYDWSTHNRMMLINEAVSVFRQHPIVGCGTDCFQFLSSFQAYSHNNYVELLANNGIIGAVAYYWIYIYIIIKSLRRIIRYHDDSSILILTITVVTLLLDYGEVSYYNKMTYIYISWSLIYLKKRDKEERLQVLKAQNGV